MQEQTCPTCYGEGIENHFSRSRAQTYRDSPWFYSVYCKVCGHIDGIFAHEVFPSTRFCQVVEAETLIKQAGASPQSYPPFRRPAPSL
jgi:hypothetical protein